MQSRSREADHSSNDAGQATLELVVMFPLLLLLLFGSVQAGLYFHARDIAMSAAEAGLRAGRVEGGTLAEADQRATAFAQEAGGGYFLRDLGVEPATDGQQMTVTVTGTPPVLILGGGPRWTITQTATGPIEQVN